MQFSNSKLKLRFLRSVTREPFNFVGKNPLQRMRAQDLLNPGDCEPAPTRTQPCGNACVRAGLFAFLAVVSRTAFCSPREHQWPSGTSDWAMPLWYITVLTQQLFGMGKHGRRASSVRVAWRKIWVGVDPGTLMRHEVCEEQRSSGERLREGITSKIGEGAASF